MKRLLLTVGVLMTLFIDPASATHDLRFDFSTNPTTKGVPAATHSFTDYGTTWPVSGTSHGPAGHLINEEGAANAPLEGELIGDGNVRGKFNDLGCFFYNNVDTNVYWDDLDNTTEEPANSVARIKITSTLSDPVYAYVVESGTDSYQTGTHYDIVMLSVPTGELCTGSDFEVTLDTFAYSEVGGNPTTRWVAKNPATAGTYTAWQVYSDGTNTHSDSDPYTITNN